MKLIIAICMLLLSGFSFGQECRKYTPEQRQLIQKAYDYGLSYNYELTLAAIVVKESFVGGRVIRYNPNDPSTGLTHIQFATLRDLSGLGYWDSVILSEKLMDNDILAFEYSVKKLNSVRGDFWTKWKRYNGSGKDAEDYANEVRGIINQFKRCGVFK